MRKAAGPGVCLARTDGVFSGNMPMGLRGRERESGERDWMSK